MSEGSAQVEPTQPRPHVLWADIKHAITGAAGATHISFTHNAEEGVAATIIEDLELAVRAVLERHGWTA